MRLKDIGPRPQSFDLEQATRENTNYRMVAFEWGLQKTSSRSSKEVSDGWCVLISAGRWHNVTNIGEEPVQVYAIYAPGASQAGKVHESASDAADDNDDEPAQWSVQPPVTPPDKHA